MQVSDILGLVVILTIMIRELTYFTPHRMIYEHKGIMQYLVFAGGILVLLLLAAKFATTWFHACFAIMGIVALSALFFKQGMSSKGILTVARGKELYRWDEIASVNIETGELVGVRWFKENGSLIMKQTYAKKDVEAIKERVLENQITNYQYARIETERLFIETLSDEEIEALIKREADPDMQQAYSEMLDGCVKHPEQRLWYTVWNMRLKNEEKKCVGDLCFKGLGTDGTVEIGYGMQKGYEGQGYMSEAVRAMVDWGMKQDAVKRIEAETDPDNKASQRILAKAGFKPNGVMGEEGPRFVIEK